MATGISTYLANKWLDHLFRNTAYSPAATVYLACHTADPGYTGASENTSVARVAVTFAAASNRAVASNAAVTFTNMPVTTITHVGLWDNATSGAGNFLWGIAVTSRTFASGDIYNFASGQITVTCSGGISTYAANGLLDRTFRNQAFTSPTTVYHSLHTGDPSTTGANEVTGGSYARQACAFDAAASRTIANTAQEQFTMPVATVTYAGIWDALTTGNFLWGGATTASRTYASGDIATINAGETDITLTDS